MKIKKRRSICKRYVAIFIDNDYRHSEIVDTLTGIKYEQNPIEKDNRFYAKKHQMGGFSAYSPDYNKKLFTLYFMDCIENAEIKPYTGNTVVNNYEAYFRVPK